MNKKNSIIIGAIIVLIIIAVVAMAKKDKAIEGPQNPPVTTTDSSGNPITTPTTGGTKPASSSATTPTPATLSRQAALDLYQDKIVRITDQCKATPFTETFTLKKGTKVMLDNDSTKMHTVVFAGTSYQIGAQSYRIVTLPNDGMLSSSCSAQTGITTISVGPAR